MTGSMKKFFWKNMKSLSTRSPEISSMTSDASYQKIGSPDKS